MTTRAQRDAWRRDLENARDRAERATWYGDRAGALIAGADARAILRRLTAHAADRAAIEAERVAAWRAAR